jgi:hypothetical protein
MFWEALMVIAILTTLVNLPVDLAFFASPRVREYSLPASNESAGIAHSYKLLRREYPVWYGINLFTDVAYMTDVILMFRTGYVDSTTEKVDRAERYTFEHYFVYYCLIYCVHAPLIAARSSHDIVFSFVFVLI